MKVVNYPVGPTPSPLKATLLDTAAVRDEFANLPADGLFDSYNCLKFTESAEFCLPNSKDLSQAAAWQSGIRFAAYGGLTCQRIGLDLSRMESEVRRVFEAGESTAVEKALMEQRFVADGGLDPQWAAPVDITPGGGAVSPLVGVALLEGLAASEYVGAPTLHLPVTIASLLVGVDGAKFEGKVLNTKLGSKVVAGAGYDFPNTGPDGLAAADGEKWIYATGEVVVLRGDVLVTQAMAHTDNEVYVLGERPYIVAVDCFTAAIRVTVTA